MAQLTPEAILTLRGQMDAMTSTPSTGAPGLVYVAVNKKGEHIFQHASGTQGLNTDRPISFDSVFWFASCTKVLTGIAVMQLVEQGKLKLDDAALVEKLAPELKDAQVLNDDGTFVPKKRRITLKMLLNHTAGFGYSFISPKLRTWASPIGLDEWSGSAFDYLNSPLVNQPGEMFEYGTNLDWAGVLVERASGIKLNDYFQMNICEPLGLKHINLFPTEDMKRELVSMSTRNADGTITTSRNGHPYRRPLIVKTAEEAKTIFHSGGGGCFGRPIEHAQVIASLLNDGVHYPTGHRLLGKESVEMMFSNSIPDGICAHSFASLKPGGGDSGSDVPQQGFGLSFSLQLNDSLAWGKGTASGGGVPNLKWWADRKNGIGAFGAAQILPASDAKIGALWADMAQTIREQAQ